MKYKANIGSVFSEMRILYHQGKQYIPDVTTVEVPGIFRGRPVIKTAAAAGAGADEDIRFLPDLCPTGAIDLEPLRIDLGKCIFCGDCERACPSRIKFTKDYKIFSATRNGLIIREGEDQKMTIKADEVRKEIRKYFGTSLKLRQVSAAGDNSCEWELNASGNVNFDMGRFGIEFVASPRHANGIVVTGPISQNMAEPLQICYDAIPDPKIIILAGTDAISGGIFAGSPAIDRSFLNKYQVDLYLAGNPTHPLTIINGILALTRGN
ncbi:MAG: 4Fe-4S binding protein [Bacteroidales bacterium]|nr:4Fe-4S binding protein [Bacteroidales bacterium]